MAQQCGHGRFFIWRILYRKSFPPAGKTVKSTGIGTEQAI